MGSSKDFNGVSIGEIEDLIHNFLIIMLEHSMRQKDGWKVCLHFSLASSCLLFFSLNLVVSWTLSITSYLSLSLI